LDHTRYPKFGTRKQQSSFLNSEGVIVSDRSMERWPVTVRHVNGHAILETQEVFEHVQRMIDEAPAILGGDRAVEHNNRNAA
jgi:hypothetical protein